MSWSDVVDRFDPKIENECRAGILVGCRLPISESPEAASAAQEWAATEQGVELWIVDDLLGLASEQPIFAGICLRQAYGLENDHRTGLSVAEYESGVREATSRMGELFPALGAALEPYGFQPGPIGPHFVWSGPLCGGFLIKGVFTEEYRDEELWFDNDVPCPVFESSRGARQDPAPGGVRGAELFRAIYDCSDEPPLLTPELLSACDGSLEAAGLLKDARLFVLPHYD
ncbi:MAG TPA: hypothetical protein VE981_00840 [Planctomycetota bacterium]|nr:hypothetical protein [Planctomycetota bacterium]